MSQLSRKRSLMIDAHLAARGIWEPALLDAFRAVPREAFVPAELREMAYDDKPLPIGDGQTISQPYIVALTVQALGLEPGDRVLEIGTGSGYAAAILGRVAERVFTVERIPALAETARQRLHACGSVNVHVRCADGSLGWPEHAPYEAIAVAAGGPQVPAALKQQLAIGGRLVMPVGKDEASQMLVRVTRTGASTYREEPLTAVRFVPLIGEQGWADPSASVVAAPAVTAPATAVSKLVREAAEPIRDLGEAAIAGIVERIGDARVVLIGEATHGTSEFYDMRARITEALIEKRGFQFVAVEADWPDAARIDEFVRGGERRPTLDFTPFTRFPQWMWRNVEVRRFVEWLAAFNADRRGPKVGFHGLDLYSMFTSIAVVLSYLGEVDPEAQARARRRYGGLLPWREDPAGYGRAVLVGRSESVETQVVAMLREMLERRIDYAKNDGDRFFDAAQNARLVANAEHYYRAMYQGAVASWNQRDQHMFDTLQSLFACYGPAAKGVVWEHNSHVGDARATEMGDQGEHNVGQLTRIAFGDSAYIIGLGTDHGTVAAADGWDAPMQRMTVRPAHDRSFERIFHETGVPAFALHLRQPSRPAVREELGQARLERAIGVIYRPETEIASHYFDARLAHQFDEYIWFDESRAITPLAPVLRASREQSATSPF